MHGKVGRHFLEIRFIILARGEGIVFGSVCLSVFVCLHKHEFFSATARRIERIFMIGATTHVECFKYNYDIIGHVVRQPRWKKGKTLDRCISETAPGKKLKLGTWQEIMGN